MWISVDEQLPEPGQVILAWHAGEREVLKGSVEWDHDRKRIWFDTAQFEEIPDVFAFTDKITHWQPLPAPPISERSAGE